jgi:hypothetical protein
MSDSLMRTIDRRARTSDGDVMCSLCGNIIEKDQSYISDASSGSGILVERDICMECAQGGNKDDSLRAFLVTVATIFVVMLLAAAFMG